MKNQVFDHNTVVDMQYGRRYYFITAKSLAYWIMRDIDIVIAFKDVLILY